MTQKVDLSQVGILDKLGQGGQGIVYRAPSVRSTYAKSMVYKAYKPATLASLDVGALEALPQFLEALPYADGARLINLAAWPCAVVADGGKTAGFLMPSIPEEFFTEIWTNKPTPSTVLAEFQHLLNDPQILAMRFRGSAISDRQRLELLHQLALGLAFLHERGVVVGDISPKNVLYSLSPIPAIYFIDCDAMRVKGVSLSNQVETPGWAVPRGEEKATVYSDRYKLGLMALRLLVGDQDTKDVRRLPGYVPQELRGVITHTLSSEPQDRPELLAWDAALTNAAAAVPIHQAKPPYNPPIPPTYPSPPPTVVTSRPQAHQQVAAPISQLPQPPTAPAAVKASRPASWLLVPGAFLGLFALGAMVWNGGNTVSSQPITASVASEATRTVTASPTTETVTETVNRPSPTPRQTAPTNRPTRSGPSVSPIPSGDLGLSVPMRNPPCDGRGIVILTSVTTPGKYAEGVAAALNKFPGSSYLRTDMTCPSLRATSDDGYPIYAVYFPGGRTRAQLCAAVEAAGIGAYGKVLDFNTDPSYIVCAA
jgi:serine/threonine protein kinase